ncbi:MAG TPA: S41 family peptidase [Pricia sp.]|nr:S41 family peptidase [Pricia sp.]
MKIALWVLFLSFTNSIKAQLSDIEKKKIISRIGEVLEERYVFPEMAETMKNGILENFASGNYDTVSSGRGFAFQLTEDLRNISKDLHLGVSYSDSEISTDSIPTVRELKEQQEWMDTILKENGYGVTKTDILEGNIGYIEMPMFGPLDRCADTLVAAMRKIEDTKALIIDLRNCRGSLDENTIPFLCSYFFEEPVHLFDFYIRPSDTTKQFWIYAWLPYKKYVDKPIFILTSGRTFSGGEELAYDLQQLKRAMLIGETTKGGANPNERVVINTHYAMAVPYMRSVNPITQTNWEGSGVQPDSTVTSNRALYAAHILALDTLLTATTDVTQRRILSDQIKKVEAAKPVFRKVKFVLEGFEDASEVIVSGSFNFWGSDVSMAKQGNKWMAEVEVNPGAISYQFIVDGRWITDPANPHTTSENGHTNSLLKVP